VLAGHTTSMGTEARSLKEVLTMRRARHGHR